MGCVKLVIPETGFVGEEKFRLSPDGGGFWNWVSTNQNHRRRSVLTENWSKDLERSGLDVAFGEGHGNMIFLVHKNMVILIVFTGGGCL